MKRNISIICIGALMAILTVACETTQVTVEVLGTVPTLNVSQSVTAYSDGGSYSFSCSVSDPAEDGSLNCTADASWISGFDSSVDGTVSFTVGSNTGDDIRTGNITVAYNYTNDGTRKSVVKRVGVIQYGTAAPSLSVQPNAVAASYDGGAYSFGYEVTNAVEDGILSCAASAGWINGFDYSEEGTVNFDVDAYDGEDLRTGTITVTYTYGYTALAMEVTVVQDHPDKVISPEELIGTYVAHGYAYGGTGTATEQEWELKMYPNDSTTVIIDGLTPQYVGNYPETEAYIAKAHVNSAGQIVIPGQFTGTRRSTHYYDYYYGYQVCTNFTEENGWYRNTTNNQPDCLLTYDLETETWTSDYGFFLGSYLTLNDFTTWLGFFDVTNPGFTLVKVSDSTDSDTTESVKTLGSDVLHTDHVFGDESMK